MKKRLLEFILSQGMTINKFEHHCGIAQATIGKSTNLSMDSLAKVLDKFPNLNANWLLTGQGEMLTDMTINQTNVNGDNKVCSDNHDTSKDEMYMRIIKEKEERIYMMQQQMDMLCNHLSQMTKLMDTLITKPSNKE